jgi:phage terminase small subunit
VGNKGETMNERQQRFVHEYVKDFNGTQAAIRAGYSENGAAVQANSLLSNPKIKAAVEERKEEVAIQAKIDAAWVLKQWHDISTADSNDLTQIRRTCCRHCFGFGHRYQWTEVEYGQALDNAIADGKEAPDGMGGFGFNVNADPNPECPECGGNGIESIFVADTRKLKGKARTLYNGVQKTKDGLKVVTRDKDAALLNIAKYLGMLVDRKEITGAAGGPLAMVNMTAEDLTDDQLAAILQVEGLEDDNQA